MLASCRIQIRTFFFFCKNINFLITKKKSKTSKEKEKKISADAQWCLDSVEALNFKKIIEHFECLDRNQAQTRYGRVLKSHFNAKSNRVRRKVF